MDKYAVGDEEEGEEEYDDEDDDEEEEEDSVCVSITLNNSTWQFK